MDLTHPSPADTRRALAGSFLATGLLCGGWVFARWPLRGRGGAGLFRAGVLLRTMALVHVVGYYAFRRQQTPRHLRGPMSGDITRAANRHRVLQALLLLFTALLLDGGYLFRLCALSAAGYWAGVGLIALRRPTAPTRDDRDFLRLGFLALMPLVGGLLNLVPRLADF